MLLELFEPCIADEDALLLRIFRGDHIPLLVSLCYDFFEVVLSDCSEDAKKELSLWQFV